MSTITQTVGARIRAYRLQQGLTQEELAERAGLHNTYIGQIERGEKNLSITSLDKILLALNLSYSAFFETIDLKREDESLAAQCYEIVSSKNRTQQEHVLRILCEIDKLTAT